ncbi:MAG: DUF4019 domain-containing protein [Comamonas sp.]|uniref:DUF4019 domain-containing protein n=1 Tax=Comamonas sp. TaxID=34028 RepID=UPI002FCAC714
MIHRFPWLLGAALLAGAPQLLLAQERDSADEIIAAGFSVLQTIDGAQSNPRQIDPLWANTSAFVKTKMSQEEFITGIRQARARYGAISLRTWAGVIRVRHGAGSDLPEGLYANADFSTRLPNGSMIFEKVTFRQEPGGWRMIGYVPRENQ